MQKVLHTICMAILLAFSAQAQVTRINANQSLELISPLNNSKTLFRAGPTGNIWVSEGTESSTINLNPNISTGGQGALLNGKYIFSGTTPVHGTDLFITDGTPDGTTFLKDIVPNAGSSNPDDFTIHNGYVYFTAERSGEGRELWRTNGTAEGTVLVKDIKPGPLSSNSAGAYNIAGLGNQIIFSADGDDSGKEIWKSDGTAAGTVKIMDINPGSAGSEPETFWPLGNILLFTAKTAANGREVWRTDGTAAGTFMLKDIANGPTSSTEIEIVPGLTIPFLLGFHLFNNKAYFIASDGINMGNLFVTDGSVANTTLVKTLVSAPDFPSIILLNSINLPGKFIFAVSDANSRSELWQSDGTPEGTSVFKSFLFSDEHQMPLLFKNFTDELSGGNDVLFQGNVFFFSAATTSDGNELWKSDGTINGTVMVKNIAPGNASGIPGLFSYMYTNSALFFAADNGSQGIELWRSDGTANGTVLVQDIRTGDADAEPMLMTLNNGKIFFGANDGIVPSETDLFVVDGSYTPLPASLANFSVLHTGADVRVDWQTITESNTSHFTVERSNDGKHFEPVGNVTAAGQSNTSRNYQFTDYKIAFPVSGVLYYRLVTYDKDGSKTYSKVVPLYGKQVSWNAKLLSNTPGSPVTLQLEGLQQPVVIKLTDMSGRVLVSQKYDARQWNISLPVNGLASGIYYITVYHGSEVKSLSIIR